MVVVLLPGGLFFLLTFLMDVGEEMATVAFPVNRPNMSETLPSKTSSSILSLLPDETVKHIQFRDNAQASTFNWVSEDPLLQNYCLR